MKKRIRNKMMNNPGRYKLHQYLKYAHQWADTVSYKCRLYLILDNGKIVKTEPISIARFAIGCADALINELK